MQDHALIYKYIGMWVFGKELILWMENKWKPKGKVNLELGEKGLCTKKFASMESRT